MTTNRQQTIADTARRLFREHGFSVVSVGGICTEAVVSRVTFYKYYSNKNTLLQETATEQESRVRAEFEALLARQCNLREAAEAVFVLQRQSFDELYSAAFLRDIEENTGLKLERFFRELNEEKYAFMRSFFHTLQQRRLIQPNLPVELIGLFVRWADVLMHHPQLAALYVAAPQELPRNILELLLRDLTGGKDEQAVQGSGVWKRPSERLFSDGFFELAQRGRLVGHATQ